MTKNKNLGIEELVREYYGIREEEEAKLLNNLDKKRQVSLLIEKIQKEGLFENSDKGE